MLSKKEINDTLEHMLLQDTNLNDFTDNVEKKYLLNAPKHMAAEILTKSKRPDVLMIQEARHVSKNISLLFYSMKVGAAVAAALLLLAASPERITLFSYQPAERLTNQLYQISSQIYQMEVPPYDQKEK